MQRNAFGWQAVLILWFGVNPLTAWLNLASWVGYGLVYTFFLKRATPQNIVIGGLFGAAHSEVEGHRVARTVAEARPAGSDATELSGSGIWETSRGPDPDSAQVASERKAWGEAWQVRVDVGSDSLPEIELREGGQP